MSNYWSPLPRDAYTVFSKEYGMVGFGALPELKDLAVWNLFWLSSMAVDGILDYVGDPLKAPMISSLVEPCMETVQMSLGDMTVRDMAVALKAEEFIDLVEGLPNPGSLPIVRYCGVEDWLIIAKHKVAQAAPFMVPDGNLMYVNFGGSRGKIIH